MKLRWLKTLCSCCFGLLAVPLVQAQVCLLSNANLAGSYGFVASQGGTTPTTTGTTTATSSSATSGYSTTELGKLLGGIAAGDQFGLSGVLTFDGAGHIDAESSTGTSQVVGTYSVNPDCSITVSLSDVFGTNTTPATFVGIILGRGTEIDLTTAANLDSQTAAPATSSTGTTTTGTTTTTTSAGQGLTIKLVQLLYRNGCSVATIGGLYGFVLNPDQVQAASTTGTGTTAGTGTTTASTVQPSAVIGYLYFSGAGSIIAQPTTANYQTIGTSYASLVFTGTYTVNPDCSGTMSISTSSPSTSSSTSTTAANQTLTINFVISPGTFSGQAGNPNPGVSIGGPVLSLSFSDSNESGWGYAEPE
jgi:mucin-2